MDVGRKNSRVPRPKSSAVGTGSQPQTITVIPTDGEPFDLTLPLTTRIDFNSSTVVMLGVISLLCILGLIELFLLIAGELEGLPFWLMGFPLFVIAGVHHVRDTRDPRCSITLHKDWLWDRRLSNSPIPWSSFSRADIIRHREGIVKVNLVLRGPLPQLRLGMFRSVFGSPRKISSNVLGMSISPDILANAIACMVVRHGGTASGTGKYVDGPLYGWRPAPNPADR